MRLFVGAARLSENAAPRAGSDAVASSPGSSGSASASAIGEEKEAMLPHYEDDVEVNDSNHLDIGERDLEPAYSG